jgi:hypothetical protein
MIKGSNLEILNLDKFQQNIYKTIFKIFKEKIDLKFNFIPTRIILSFKNEILKEYSKEKGEFFEKLKKDHLNKGSIKENGYEIKNFINNYFEKNEELFFDSITEASKKLGIRRTDISTVLSGNQKTAKKHKFFLI